MIKIHRIVLAVCVFCALPSMVWSEVPVVDDSEHFTLLEESQEDTFDQSVPESQEGDIQYDENTPLVQETGHENAQDNALLLDKLQGLQQEVQELRGQLEVQAHDLKMLQQQQLAFYKDLDARLRQDSPTLAKKEHSSSIKSGEDNSSVTFSNNSTPSRNPANRLNPADEQISYLAAYELVKNKKYHDASQAMQKFIEQYPQSGYVANAQYWLGELLMVQQEYSKAIEHFEIVLQHFPSSSKSSASLLKIGYALEATGKREEAKKRLQQVVRNYPDTHSAQLASMKLQTL